MRLNKNLLTLALLAALHGTSALAEAEVTAEAAPAAAAQQEAAGSGETVLESVNVTANRRVQSIQEYAGTIQSFSGDLVEKLGINTDFTNLQTAVPGLQITRQEGKSKVSLHLPRAAVSRLNITVPGEGLDFTLEPAAAYTTQVAAGHAGRP